jgi:hypothetical protein
MKSVVHAGIAQADAMAVAQAFFGNERFLTIQNCQGSWRQFE